MGEAGRRWRSAVRALVGGTRAAQGKEERNTRIPGRGWCICLLAAFAIVLAGCNDDGAIPSQQQISGVLYQYFHPEGAGTLGIDTSGGEGLNGDGGYAGRFVISAYASGDIMVLPNGWIDTSFEVPTAPIELGDNVRTIAADETIRPDEVTRRLIGDDGLTEATGLHVLPGVVLTLLPNSDRGNDGTLDEARVRFDDGVLIEGTIVLGEVETLLAQVALPDATAALDIDAANIVITATGVIETHGRAGGAGQDGADGGEVDLRADGTLINQGAILTYGGDGANGGAGGRCDLSSDAYRIFNTGPISTYGGTGLVGEGGQGGRIDIDSNEVGGGISNSGDLDSSGGNGAWGAEKVAESTSTSTIWGPSSTPATWTARAATPRSRARGATAAAWICTSTADTSA
jgi:hypothetical protein